MTIDVSAWKYVGETANTRFYVVEDRVLAAVPNDGARDNRATALENTTFQNTFLKELGHPGVVVVFFDRMVSQDRDARRVYQTETDPAHMLGSCLVGGTALSRAMASFSIGFSRQRVPVRLFPNLDAALVWARALNREAKERRS
jgi:hypothetical protein